MQTGFNDHLPAFLVAFIPGLVNLGLSGYVYFTMPRRQIIQIFSAMLFCSFAWETSVALLSISPDRETAIFVDDILAPIGMMAGPLIFHFTFLFTRVNIKTRHSVIINISYAVTFLLAITYPTLNKTGNFVYDPFFGWMNTRSQGGIFGAFVGIVIQVQYFWGIGILVSALRKTKRKSERFSQTLLILIPYVIIIVQALITEAILPQVLGINPIPLSAPSSALFAIATVIALRRFKLFGGISSIPREELLGQLTDIVIVADNKLNINYVNKAGLDFIGYTQNEIEDKNLVDYFTIDNSPGDDSLKTLVARVAAGEDVENLHGKILSHAKESLPVIIKADALVARNEMEGILLVCQDVAELELAHEQTARNTRHFQKIIEKSKDAITISDLDGVVRYASPSVYNVLGYYPEEIEGNFFGNYVHPDSVEDTMVAFTEVLRGVVQEDNIFKCLHKDGSSVWVEVNLMNLLDDADIQGLVAVFRDVTERRNNELEREKSFALFEALINNVSHPMLVVGADRTLMKMNHQFCETFSISLTPDQMVGMSAAEGVALVQSRAKDPEQFAERIKEIVSKRQPIINEIVEFADGRIFERDYFPVNAHNGILLGHFWRYVDVTERLRIHEELEEKNNFLEFTQEIGHMGSWTANLETGESWWSKEALAIYGLTEEEFDGRGDTYFRFIHPEDLAEVNRISFGAIARHEPYSVEHRIVLRDGTIKWIHGRGIAEYDGERPIKLMGITQDVTVRKQMEQELIEKNRFLEYTQEIGQMGSWWARIDEVDEIWWSDETLAIFGLTRDEFVPKRSTYFDSIHPDDKDVRKRATDAGIASGRPFDYEHRIITRDGTLKWVYNRVAVEFDGNRPVMLTGIVQDITSRKLLQQELIEKNKFLELTQEIGQMGSWWANIGGEDAESWWSKEALTIYGITEEEFDRKASTYFNFIHPDDLSLVYQVSGKGFASRKPFDIEHRIVLKDGSIKWVYNRLIAEFEGDRPVKMIGIVQDITKRKKDEHEILSQNQELIKINSELDKFVYSASHDIRSPLTSILGLVNIASEEISDPGAQLYFEMIRDRVERLDEFTLDIIHFSKNARMEVDKEEVHVKPLIEEIVESLKYQQIAQHINFEMNVEPGLTIVTDRSRLTVVLSNMVSNAIKYQREGIIPFVRISAWSEKGDIKFSIEDNGIGITADKVDKIFDMFTRFTQKSTGSGLGLYIVKEIMEKLSGQIQVESTPGEGSRFIVTLPDHLGMGVAKKPITTAA